MENPAESSSVAALVELRQENERLRRIAELKKSYGIHFYRPHLKQHRFHLANVTGRYGRTGNRFGKSGMGIAEDIGWCMGGRVWYRNTFDVLDGEGNIAYHHVGTQDHSFITQGIPQYAVKGLLLVVDWDMAKKVFTNRTDDPKTCGKLFKLLPHESIDKVHISRGGHVDQIEIKRPTEFGGGVSTLTIDTIESWKHNKLGGESADWDFIHVDEPVPEPMFKSYARGLMDRHGRYWFTCTPLDEMWINDEFSPTKERIVKEAPEGMEFVKGKGATRYIITGSIYDNPHRTPEGVSEFEATPNREEKAARLFGLPLAYAGLVYPEFTYDEHVLLDVPEGWEDYHLPPKNYTIRLWWDYHTRLPQAVLFFATAPDGTIFVYDELFTDNLIDSVAKSVLAKSEGRYVETREIDPFALIEHPVTKTSIQDELLAYGLWFDPATKDLSTGINKVRQRLKERVQRKGLNGQTVSVPTIYFSPHLTQTLFEFSHYVYDLKKQEPKDEHNHMMENLYRAILHGCTYMEPPSDAPRKSRPFVIRDNQDLGMMRVGSLLNR